jgi:hypothetical protein
LTTLSLWEKKGFSYACDFICLRHSEIYCSLRRVGLLYTGSEPAQFPCPGPFGSQTLEPCHQLRLGQLCQSRVLWLGEARRPNLLKPCVFFVHRQFQHSKSLHFAHSVNLCFFQRISEQRVTFTLYDVNGPVFITEMETVYCEVRVGSLTKQTAVSPSRVHL